MEETTRKMGPRNKIEIFSVSELIKFLFNYSGLEIQHRQLATTGSVRLEIQHLQLATMRFGELEIQHLQLATMGYGGLEIQHLQLSTTGRGSSYVVNTTQQCIIGSGTV